MFMFNPSENQDFCDEPASSSRESNFLRQLARSYHHIYSTGLAIVGNRDDADDVIQEVCVILWQKYDEFEEGTNFRRWSEVIAFNVAKAYSRKQRRRKGFGLSDYALMKVAQVKSGGDELFELQCEILKECLDKLPPTDRDFLSDCYRHSDNLTRHARELGRSVETIYTKLKRLRKRLSECVTRSLGKGS